ncbi:hypothetical protein ACQEUU_04175 [Nonomuraea sp. CA-218870]|uniref:hypothetical protein n=1 Tax=Nonomuraea sp. CA-218870 TaxID=3239998 RepID=UPI003D8FC5DF
MRIPTLSSLLMGRYRTMALRIWAARTSPLILQSRKAEGRGVLLDALVGLAVRTAWEPIKSMIHTTGIEELQRGCRILAVLICPAPENHKAVQDGALLPLAKERLLETSRERLEQVFPADWARRLRESHDDASVEASVPSA